jgi:hypothetical protein
MMNYELIAAELQQRIGQIVGEYEAKMAVLKAGATEQLKAKDAEIATLKQTKENKDGK